MSGVSVERLFSLKIDLAIGAELDDDARRDLLTLVNSAITSAPKPRGAPVTTKTYAGVVGVLVEEHGIPLKEALFLANPAATSAKQRDSLRTTYHRLKRSGEHVRVPLRLVNAALRRFHNYNKRK